MDGRVYTLDGTMDSSGPPYGGIDYFESKVAEPDGMLSDMIKVLHPAGTNYQPSGMTILRHAATPGDIVSMTAAMCTDPTAARPIKSATCAQLAATNSAVLGWLAALDSYKMPPPPPPASNTGDDSSNTGLIIVAIALGAVLALTLAALFILNQKLAAAKTASANVLSDKKLASVQSAAA